MGQKKQKYHYRESFVKENLQIVDENEIFTIIAIAEMLDYGDRKLTKKEA